MHQLRAADLQRSRLELFWIRVVLSAVMVTAITIDIVQPVTVPMAPWDRAALGSVEYAVSSLALTVVALLVTLWVAPRLTMLWLVPVAWLLPLTGVEVPILWRMLSVVCLLLLAGLLIRSWRARPTGVRQKPMLKDLYWEPSAFWRAWPGWAVIAGGVVVTVGLLLVHQSLMVETREFEARATQELAEVRGYDDDPSEVRVRINGDDFALDDPLWDERPAVGSLLPVLVDPEDAGHIVFTSALEDPSWLLGLTLAVPIVGLRWGAPIILRSRRRRALLVDGAAASTVVVTMTAENGYRVLPTDGSSPVLDVVNLQGVIPFAEVEMHDDDDAAESEWDNGEVEESFPLDEAGLAAWADDAKRDMENWDDESEAADFSDVDEEEAQSWMEAEIGPDIHDRETFVMVGPWSHGSSVALLRDSGQVWLAEVREPCLRSQSQSQSQPKAEVHEGHGGRDGWTQRWGGAWLGRRADSLSQWSEQHFRWVRWVVAFAVAVAGGLWVPAAVQWNLEGGWGVFDWVQTVVLTLGLLPWPFMLVASLPSPAGIIRGRQGLVRHGNLLDEVVAPDRLVAVVAGKDAVALRLRNPDEALMVLPKEIGADMDADGAARELTSWFSTAPPTARSGRRPSAGLVGMVAMVMVWVLQIVPLVN